VIALPPVVIVPELADGTQSWQRIAHLALRSMRDVVTVQPVGDSIAADARRVRAALDDEAEPPVVLAHGYGALVASAAAEPRNAAHLIAVAGYLLDYGERIVEVVGGPESPLTTTPVDSVGWRAVPVTYVTCGNDPRVAPAVQLRLAQLRATTFVQTDAGAQPQRTHAEILTALLREELEAVRGSRLEVALALLRSA
jgi:pimeloyl-ACP methyl ester carboxylesterase